MSHDQRRLPGRRRTTFSAPGVLVRCAAAAALALFGATAVAAVAGAAPAPEHHAAPSVHHQDAPGFPGTSTTAPFNECPAVGADTSCAILLVVTSSGTQVLFDPSQGPYDGSDDEMVGIVNQTSAPVYGQQLSSSQDIFGFDGDGICTYATGGLTGGGYTGDQYCSASQLAGTDPGDYQGPINTYGAINSTQTAGDVVFPSPGLAPGASTYFSLEDALTPGQITPGVPLSTPPAMIWPDPTVASSSSRWDPRRGSSVPCPPSGSR